MKQNLKITKLKQKEKFKWELALPSLLNMMFLEKEYVY
jgi:hypothetical protein